MPPWRWVKVPGSSIVFTFVNNRPRGHTGTQPVHEVDCFFGICGADSTNTGSRLPIQIVFAQDKIHWLVAFVSA